MASPRKIRGEGTHHLHLQRRGSAAGPAEGSFGFAARPARAEGQGFLARMSNGVRAGFGQRQRPIEYWRRIETDSRRSTVPEMAEAPAATRQQHQRARMVGLAPRRFAEELHLTVELPCI